MNKKMLMGTITYNCDAAGNVLTSTDARGILTSRAYDALNRLVQVSYADGQSAVYAYDQGANALGRLTSVTDASGSTAWSYDAQGRIVQKRQIVGSATLIIRYAYDAQGRLNQTTYPSGRNIGYAYDAAGRVAAITVDGQPLISNIIYQPFGAPTSWSWGNGSAYSRSFDLDGRISAFPLGADNARSLTYDAAGRITRASDLVASPPPNLPDSATLNVSSSSNRLLSSSGTSPRSYTYDAAGNVIGDGTNAYAYDARGRLTQVSAAGSSIQYQLNALGQRVAKIGGNAANGGQYFAYDEAGHLLGEYDASLAPVQETIWLGDTPVAVVKPNSGVFFVFTDQLGSPRVVTTPSLRTVWRWESDPFGNGAPVEGADDSGFNFKYNLRFPGQYFDAETGLHYNMARDYDPAIGRYIQSDPIGLVGGINTYSYVKANPLRYTDPYGLDTAGCDGVPNVVVGPCTLRCCARHDECYDKSKCTGASWYKKDGCVPEQCDACNQEVRSCILKCTYNNQHNANWPMYYCAKLHRYITIPGDFATQSAAEAACEYDHSKDRQCCTP